MFMFVRLCAARRLAIEMNMTDKKHTPRHVINGPPR